MLAMDRFTRIESGIGVQKFENCLPKVNCGLQNIVIENKK
jgi:hypothetical protein